MGNTEIILAVVLSTLLILLLIAGIVISFFISGRQRTKQEYELVQARLGYERELRKVELEVSEQLMQKFSQELHDNIGQILTCINLEVENRKIDHPDFAHELKPIGIYIEDATRQLRLLSRSMNTEYVSHIGLAKAIDIEVQRMVPLRKFVVTWEYDDRQSSLDKNQQLVLFRIFQEVINNAMKHSGAKNIYVKLTFVPEFELMIRDDGKGFLKDHVYNSEKASGLRNIMRRASMAGISCDLKTTPGAGCSFVFRVAAETIPQTTFSTHDETKYRIGG